MNIDKKDKIDTKLIDDMVSLGDLLDKHYQLKGYKSYDDYCGKQYDKQIHEDEK